MTGLTKQCKFCLKIKSIEDFKFTSVKNKHGILYREALCRLCSNKRYRERDRNNGANHRVCSKCKINKTIDNFHKGRVECKSCNKKYKSENKEKISLQKQKYYLENKIYILNRCKEYRRKNEEIVKERARKSARKNRGKRKLYYKNYLSKEENKQKKRDYENNCRKNDLNFKLKKNLRGRVSAAVRGIYKSRSTMELLGCSIEYFKEHLENQFDNDMSWVNYGYRGWHVGHISPCENFDLRLEEEQRKCFHYTNLKPQWGKENIRNGDLLSNGKRARDTPRIFRSQRGLSEVVEELSLLS